MFSTAGDLSKFADCFMNQGVSKGKQVIPIDVIRMMSGKHTPVGVMHNYFGYPGSYYGYGLMSFSFHGVSFVGHPGETTTQNLLFAMAPKSKTSLVIMSNSGLYPFIRTFEVLTDAFLGEYSKPLDTSTVNYDTRTDREVSGTGTDLREQLKEFTGRYFIPSISGGKENSIEVFLKGTALQLELSEEEAYELTRLGDDHFSYVSPQLKFDLEIRFFRDMDGKVRYLNNYWKTAVKVNP